jgi:DNA polymerase-3 subunit gamma/tau
MSYVPLARKYRPQTFDALVGQSHVAGTLTRALESGRLAQAYLFAGLRGVGKTSAARILAKCLNCEQGPTATPCQTCASCVQIVQGNSLDVIEIDGASNRGIDEIRSLRESVPFSPTTGKYRVYIIDEVHMLTTEAFNALLKTLEEPPAHVKFIFATTAPNKVPATILSRCQRFDFRRLEPGTIVTALKKVAQAEKISISDEALYAVARASDGSLRDAEVTLDQLHSFVKGRIEETHVTELLGAIESDALRDWVQAMLEHRTTEALTQLHTQIDQGKEATQLLSGLLRHFRNLLIIRTIQETPQRAEVLARLVDEPAERLKALETQAQLSSAAELLLLVQIVSGAYELVRRSPAALIVLEMTVIKLATREEWQSLEEITRQLQALGQGQPAAPAARPMPAVATAVPAARPAVAAKDVPALQWPEEVLSIWPTFLEQLGAKKMSLAAYLAGSKPLQREGSQLTVGLSGSALHEEVLNAADNRKLVAELLGSLLGGPVAVQYTGMPALAAAQPAGAGASKPAAAVKVGAPANVPPLVQDIVNLFNATLEPR